MHLNISPETTAAIRHIAILAVLGAASVCILPAYEALSHSTASMPLPISELLDFILPLAYASVVKFKDEIDVKLKAEENTKLIAKNASLAKMVNQQSKEMEIMAHTVPGQGLNSFTTQTTQNPDIYSQTSGNYSQFQSTPINTSNISAFTYTISPSSYLG